MTNTVFKGLCREQQNTYYAPVLENVNSERLPEEMEASLFGSGDDLLTFWRETQEVAMTEHAPGILAPISLNDLSHDSV